MKPARKKRTANKQHAGRSGAPRPASPDAPPARVAGPTSRARAAIAAVIASGVLVLGLRVLARQGLGTGETALLGLVEAGGVFCLAHLWWRGAERRRQWAWSPLVLVPLVGPLLYGAVFDPLPPQPEKLQARRALSFGTVDEPPARKR